MTVKPVIVLLLISLTLCNCYRLLGVFPMPARSHWFLGNSLMKGLAEAGHDVTFISPFPDKEGFSGNNGSFKEVLLDGHLEFMTEIMTPFVDRDDNHKRSIFSMLMHMNEFTYAMTEKTLDHPNVQKLLNSGEKFDAVIITEFMMDALKGLAPHFDAHLIGFANHGGISWSHSHMGVPTLPSYLPDVMLGHPPRMNFKQRLINTAASTFMGVNSYIFVTPNQRKLHSKYFPNNPDYDLVMKNISLMLFYSQTGTTFSAQLKVPTMIDVAGFHIKPPKTLPKDLKKVMDEAEDGVIYFSMGSNFKSEALPKDAFDALIKVFSKRKEKIFFKYGHDTLPNKPDNMQIGKWFPQQEILAHPNLKVFVSHGGLLSTTETLYHGVPIVALPIMADQKLNALTATQAGFALTVNIEDLTEETFGRALEEVISNPIYRETVKEKSYTFKDTRHPPIEDANYWIEYVIRHKGAKHLRVAFADMPWYQFYLLDVIGTVIGALLVALFLVAKTSCFVLKKFKICHKRTESTTSKSSKKKVKKS